jgi:enoyl-CoA hydratase
MNFENLSIKMQDSIAIITVNRPDKLNALNIKTIAELETAFNQIKDDSNVKVIIITGSGEKAFVAGADISELNKLDMTGAKAFAENGQRVFNLIEQSEKPVIAAVNGFALGGGCELALACHIRIASENAKFGQPEINLGIIPGYGGTQRLPRLINSGLAAEYILTGDMIDSKEALRIGLVTKVFPQTELIDKAIELAAKIASKGQQAIKYALKGIKAVEQMSLKDGLTYEASLFGLVCGTEDAKEGTAAFLEKRKPVFKNK